MSSKYFKNRERYAVFEKTPAHGNKPNGLILGDYNTKEEAEKARKRYGYDTDNYYVDKVNHYEIEKK